GGAAFDEAADRKAVVAPVHELARELGLFRPLDLLEAAIEGGVVVAAVELVFALEWRDGGDLIWHLPLRHEIAAAELDASKPQILRHHVEQTRADKIGLEARWEEGRVGE